MRAFAVVALLAFCSAAALSNGRVSTPFGHAPPECVLQVPSGSRVSRIEPEGVRVSYPDGTAQDYPPCADREWHKYRTTPRADGAYAKRTPAPAPADFPYHLWLCTMLSDMPENVVALNATWPVPQFAAGSSQIVYIWTGIEGTYDGSLNVLQPVLAQDGGALSLSSWNCCPEGMTTQSTPITDVNPGDTVYGEMVEYPVGSGSYNVISTINGQTTTLAADMGSSYNGNIAETCYETYSVTACNQLPCDSTTFSNLVLQTTSGIMDPIAWEDNFYETDSGQGGTPICNGTAVAIDGTDTQIGFDCQA